MPNKKNLLIIIIFLIILLIGIVSGVFLLRRQQKKAQASVASGQATITVSPQTGTYQVGDNFSVTISFNTAGIPISGITARLKYPYSGTTSELSSSSININSTLLADSDWSCPIKKIDVGLKEVAIDISCINFSASGFVTSAAIPLASFSLKVNQVPLTNPTILSFDAQNSIITQKSDGEDVLLTPQGVASYTIITTTPTSTITAQPTSTATASATPKTATPSATPTIPVTGVSLPTIIGFIAAAVLITLSAYLAL